MKQQTAQLKFILLVAVFISIQIVLTLIFGVIQIGALRITTLHIPTILAGILLGVKGGAIVGLSFGLISVYMNTVNPNMISFAFTPFAPALSGYSGHIGSLLIAIAPRVLLGIISATLYKTVTKNKEVVWAAPVVGVIATILHTIMVLGLIFIIFAEQYASALNLGGHRAVLVALAVVVGTNGVYEAILAAILMAGLVNALKKPVKAMIS